jgi:hypothetical protein
MPSATDALFHSSPRTSHAACSAPAPAAILCAFSRCHDASCAEHGSARHGARWDRVCRLPTSLLDVRWQPGPSQSGRCPDYSHSDPRGQSLFAGGLMGAARWSAWAYMVERSAFDVEGRSREKTTSRSCQESRRRLGRGGVFSVSIQRPHQWTGRRDWWTRRCCHQTMGS